MKIEDHGIGIEIPPGWEAEVFRRPSAAASQADQRRLGPPEAVDHPVLHLSSFPLPPERGDFGSGAIERMSPGDVLVCLLEYDTESADTALFESEGVPDLRPSDFSADTMQRPLPGRVGVQRFFRVGARAFCLYVVGWDAGDRAALVDDVKRALRTLQID